MAIAQKLYEAGKITCLRSDAVMVAPEAQVAARSWLTAAFGEGAVPAEPPRYESKEGLQEAHEAIRPTDPAAGGLVAQEGEAVGREEGGVREGGVREGRCRPAAAVALRVVRRGAATLEDGRRLRAPVRGVARVRGRGVRGRAPCGGPSMPALAPGRRFGAVDSGGSTFAFGDCGWSPEMHRVFGKTLASANGTHRGAFLDRQDIDIL